MCMSIRQTFMMVLVLVAIVYVSGCTDETAKFEAQVKATVNPDELQAWATNMISKASFHGRDSWMVGQSDIPKWVGLIYKDEGDPGEVTVERSSEGDFVQILYGGGFGHWGLAVGSPTLVLTTNGESGFQHLWKPGIYFWGSP